MADPFTILTAGAIPLIRSNIDTDTISPGTQQPRRASGSQFSERGSSTLADDLFANWRYGPDGEPLVDFPFNQSRFQGAKILLTGENFGCGSSRESAVWMLAAWGIRCIIASSFAEIFASNCFANGLLPITLLSQDIATLATEADAKGASAQFRVDLTSCQLATPSGLTIAFTLSEFRRQGLLTGLDEIAVTLAGVAEIEAFIEAARAVRPWCYPPARTGPPKSA